ncbi:MAG: anaerobic ribonucleoside-triphosphate reductase activating protein [Candidatus Falkowbacteria bacterium]
MIIGGLQKFSLLDYPGQVAAIVFTQGCNFRCPFCYNPMLVVPSLGGTKDIIESSSEEIQKSYSQFRPQGQISEDDFFVFLKSRAGKLDAIVITGGEPTLHFDLTGFAARVKALGYKIKLDTNGTNPEMIEKLFLGNLVDYIAMDIKGAPEKYSRFTGNKDDLDKIRKSIIMIMGGRVPYEFRTTVVPAFTRIDDIDQMGSMIEGAETWWLQRFKSDTSLIDKGLENTDVPSDESMEEMRRRGLKYAKNCRLR